MRRVTDKTKRAENELTIESAIRDGFTPGWKDVRSHDIGCKTKVQADAHRRTGKAARQLRFAIGGAL